MGGALASRKVRPKSHVLTNFGWMQFLLCCHNTTLLNLGQFGYFSLDSSGFEYYYYYIKYCYMPHQYRNFN